MPDISMCKGRGCPLQNLCFRHTAKPTPHWQSYFARASMYDDATQSCRYYYRNGVGEATETKKRVKGVGSMWACKSCLGKGTVQYPEWGSGFLFCPSCGHETGMNDKYGRAIREWNKTMKPKSE